MSSRSTVGGGKGKKKAYRAGQGKWRQEEESQIILLPRGLDPVLPGTLAKGRMLRLVLQKYLLNE